MNEIYGERPPSQLERLKSRSETLHPSSPRADPPQRYTTWQDVIRHDEALSAPERPQAAPRTLDVPADQLVPVSLDAVKTVLDHMEAKYFVAGDDAIGGVWDNGYFYFFLLQEYDNHPLFQVYGQWERILSPELYPQAAIFANEWNAERAWPKAYARLLEDEETGIHGEVTVDYGPLVTLDQLSRTIDVGIAGCLAFFDEAQLAFPEAVEMEF